MSRNVAGKVSRSFAFVLALAGINAGIAVAAGTAPAAPAVAAAPAASPAVQVLTDKGLTKTGILFILPAEKEVTDGMRPLLVTKAKFDQDAKTRAVYEKNIGTAKSYISEFDFERRDLDEKLSVVKDVSQHNQLVAKVNVLTSKIQESIKYKEENESKLSALGEETRTAFIDQVLDLTKKADDANKQYAELAKDPDVKAAIVAAKGRLGPSEMFTSAVGRLKVLHGSFSSDTIAVKHDSEVPMVEVTINGKVTRSMVFDSGSSTVCIPADLAKDLGLVPGAADPVVHMQMADGKVVEARQMSLKSVRVGTFTVEDVECAVLPPTLISAQPLLGGSFLKNFIYKLDPTANELHMTRIGGDTKNIEKLAPSAPKLPKPAMDTK